MTRKPSLDLVQPFAARWQLIGFGWKARRDEPGREGTLLALAALSAFGCGLALAHADFLFAAIFAAASAAVIVEALRRLR